MLTINDMLAQNITGSSGTLNDKLAWFLDFDRLYDDTAELGEVIGDADVAADLYAEVWTLRQPAG